jgi:pimeloyl-ACP methyl ester carboxylesterase
MIRLHTLALYLCVILFVSLQSSCTDSEQPCGPDCDGSASAGELISYDSIKTYAINDLNQIRTANLQMFLDRATMPYSAFAGKLDSPKNAVKVYKVTYKTIIPELGNQETIATGMIAIPDVSDSVLPMISYQHGTVFFKNWVPSEIDYSFETQFMLSQFAAQGYIVIAADYLGLGSNSILPNTYFVRQSTEQACLDLYKAALTVLQRERKQKSKFFINGWSQGGYNTMLFLRRLEQENISVTAAFTAAAPVDPVMFINRGLFNPRPNDAEFQAAALSNMIYSIEHYNKVEGLAKKYIRPQYLAATKNFFQFKITYDSLLKVVPIVLDSVFTEEFIRDAKANSSSFWRILNNSEAYRWLSPTPLRAYGGGKDEAVPDYIATLAVTYMQTLGKQNAQAFNAGNEADHRCTYIQSLIEAKPWIDSFK